MKSELTIRNCVFAFKCDAVWEEMEINEIDDYINSEYVRFCNTCQKEVFLSTNDDDLLKNVRLNRCVAINRNLNGLTIIESGEVSY
jgi:hypothetical protein